MTPLERLLAEHEIGRLVTRFALLNDAGDWAAVAATFTSEGRFVRPSGGDAVVGRDAIRVSLESRPPRKSCHLITNVLVDLASADAGDARCSMLLYTAPPGQAAASVPALIGGFRDKVVRTPEGWRFAERVGFLDLKVGPE
ncbi:MAG: Nuclear transport factor 2 domain protein [Hyphomicrobiales bacterium]|jgi:3-phenylpropionate/cinnamic acid dioxygenase small subunit|nr:Nuclear transport factor 2 domain protein [Hyphomicrobiales bacterium]